MKGFLSAISIPLSGHCNITDLRLTDRDPGICTERNGIILHTGEGKAWEFKYIQLVEGNNKI